MANRFIFSKTKLKNQSCKDQSWDNKLTKYKSAADVPPISSERKQKASRSLARKKRPNTTALSSQKTDLLTSRHPRWWPDCAIIHKVHFPIEKPVFLWI